jgi:5-methyltetrahydropteroyltriglutamate--homocysteine methyltransferase
LQIDDPSLPDNWDMINPEPPLNEFKKFEQVRMEALNHALRGLSADRIRFHICWGSWHGPHTTDIPLKDIVDLVLSVNAGAYSVEAGNVRHEHEWRVPRVDIGQIRIGSGGNGRNRSRGSASSLSQ